MLVKKIIQLLNKNHVKQIIFLISKLFFPSLDKQKKSAAGMSRLNLVLKRPLTKKMFSGVHRNQSPPLPAWLSQLFCSMREILCTYLGALVEAWICWGEEGLADKEMSNNDILCGIGYFRPKFLQKFANRTCYLIVHCLLACTQVLVSSLEYYN